MELKIKDLSKNYGDKIALKAFSMTFHEGIYGLLGPNGAGKSTLMSIIVGNLSFDKGSITYHDEDIFKMQNKFRSILGFMPQIQTLYEQFTGFDYLGYIATLKGMTKDHAKTQIEELLEKTELADVAKKKIKSYSGGMKQRLLLAATLLNEPKILILDEPTAGLDPKQRIHVRNLIAKLALNKIVIIATHVVSDIEFIADEIILLKDGELLHQGTHMQLAEALLHKVHLIEATEKVLDEVSSKYLISNLSKSNGKLMVRVISDQEIEDYPSKQEYPTLDDIYLFYFGD